MTLPAPKGCGCRGHRIRLALLCLPPKNVVVVAIEVACSQSLTPQAQAAVPFHGRVSRLCYPPLTCLVYWLDTGHCLSVTKPFHFFLYLLLFPITFCYMPASLAGHALRIICLFTCRDLSFALKHYDCLLWLPMILEVTAYPTIWSMFLLTFLCTYVAYYPIFAFTVSCISWFWRVNHLLVSSSSHNIIMILFDMILPIITGICLAFFHILYLVLYRKTLHLSWYNLS